MAARALTVAVVFEAALVPLALALAVLLGVSPWSDLRPTAATLPLAVAATAALAAGLALLAAALPARFRAIEALLRPLLAMLFRGRGAGAVLLVSALAGLGEELLFRGVLQSWLVELGGVWPGVAIAAAIFGLAHYLSHVYFVLATAMGLYLGLLYQLTGDLLAAVLVHGLYDALAIGYLLRRARSAGEG